MALTAGLPPMPPPRSLPSWKREGERGEKDRVHLSQVSAGRSGAELLALLPRLPRIGQTETQWKHREQRGFFAVVWAELLGNYPHTPTADGSVLQVNKNKSSSLLAPVICTKISAQFFVLHAPVLSLHSTTLAAALSSSTKPSGVAVKWHKNKADRKLTSWKLWFSREQLRTTGKHNASWLRSSDMRLYSIRRKKENGLLQQLRYVGFSSFWRCSPPLDRNKLASWSNGPLK